MTALHCGLWDCGAPLRGRVKKETETVTYMKSIDYA
jgi:hypothetical protein